jgi:uncharacterized repeat protein (TIGR01451 family)
MKMVDVYFQMPFQTNLISASDNGARNAEHIVWRNISVFPGKLKQLRVNVHVNPDAKENQLLVAQVNSEGVVTTDTTRIDEADDATTQIPRMNISVTDGKKYAQPGEVLEYIVSVRNPTDDERTVNVRLQLPTETELEFASGDFSSNRKAVTWSDQVLGPRVAREYRVAIRIGQDAAEFFMIRTHASVGAAVATDTTTVHTGILPNALVVTTTDGLDQIVPGALVTYDINVQNGTNQLATEVDVNNALPSYLEFVDASEGGYWNGKKVRWNGLTVSPNGNRSLRVTGRVRNDAPRGERLKNTVAVNGFQAVDVTEVSDTVSGNAISARNQVLINKLADRSEVRPGDAIGYTVSVRNVTGETLYNVKVEDRMDSDYVRILNADNGELAGNRVRWTIPVLQAGESWDVRYNAKVDYRAPHGLTIPNIVTVSGNGMNTVSLNERIHTSEIGVISNLPPTGAAFDAIFLAMTGLAGAAQTLAQKRKLLRA